MTDIRDEIIDELDRRIRPTEWPNGMADRVLAAIDAALAARGLTVVREGKLDVERLYAAIVDELVALWGEPSDAISVQVRPIVARSIAERYARLARQPEGQS